MAQNEWKVGLGSRYTYTVYIRYFYFRGMKVNLDSFSTLVQNLDRIPKMYPSIECGGQMFGVN